MRRLLWILLAALTMMRLALGDADPRTLQLDDHRRALIRVGLHLVPFAGIAFLWFIVSLRTWITHSSRREDILLSNIQLVSGVVFITLFFVAAAAIATPHDATAIANPMRPMARTPITRYVDQAGTPNQVGARGTGRVRLYRTRPTLATAGRSPLDGTSVRPTILGRKAMAAVPRLGDL